MAALHKPYAPVLQVPFSTFDERFYDRLAEGTPWTGRELWRILHARLPEGRVGDANNRIWIIPSTRIEGRAYYANLKTFACSYRDSNGASGDCPDQVYNHRPRCAHIHAAIQAERRFLAHNKHNVLLLPKERRREVHLGTNVLPLLGMRLSND